MELHIKMNLDNAEFECDPATAAGAILIRLAEDWMALGFENVGQAAEDGARGTVMDTNGNRIGQWNLEGLAIDEQTKPKAKRLSTKNQERAKAAQKCVFVFMDTTGTDKEDVLCDLICNLRHWADWQNQNWDREVCRGLNHYDQETKGE